MKNVFIYPALLCALLFTACDNGDKIPFNNDPRTTADYLQQKWEDMQQEFTVDMSTAPHTITSKGGIKITIPQGAFTVGGQPVEGEVRIEFHEMLTMSSIVFSGTNTNYEGSQGRRYFETDGFFKLEAWADGKRVDEYMANWLKVSVPKVFNPARDWTMVWFGTEKAGQNGDQFAWGDENERQGESWTNLDGDFEFDLGKLGWCNCDMFWEGTLTTVTVGLTGTFGKFASYFAADGDTYVFFAAKGSSVLAQLYNVIDEQTVQSYVNSMPEGTQGRMFAFSVQDGVYSYAEKEITISTDMTLTLDMAVTTKDYIDGRIATLDGYK